MNLKEQLKKLRKKLAENQTKQIQVSSRKNVESHEDILTEEEKRMLDDLYKFREGYISPGVAVIANHLAKIRNINLDAKVDDFIDWYFKNMVKGHYTDIGEFYAPNDMRNFIEKMAVWYELRYPDYEINRLMPSSNQEAIEINDVMFNSNEYVNELFDENADIRALDWDEFYNAKAFIDSLPGDEIYLLTKAKYRDLVYIDPHRRSAHLHLTSRGFVKEAEEFESYTNFKIKDAELKGMHIKDVVKLLKEKGVSLPNDNELEETINVVEKWNYQKEEMLNCVMYRIIERGGKRKGPRRAFLFAKEFGRNIDIPMMYGVDYSDPGLRSFINEYIKAGGSKDLLCYIGYFSRKSKSQIMDTVSVQELIKTVNNDGITKYTKEETALHQRMVDALASQVNQNKVRKEEIKQLRLQRRLNKSKNKN